MTSSEYKASWYFSAVAGEVYDALIRKGVPGYDQIHELTCSLLKSRLPELAEVLVVGAGTGMEVFTHEARNEKWKFTACDINEKMCASLEERVTEAGIRDRVRIVSGPVEDIEGPERFDAWREYQLSAGVPPDHFEGEDFEAVKKLFHLISEERTLKYVTDAGFGEPLPFFQALMFKSWIAVKE